MLATVSPAGDVVISEIMYHPGMGEPGYPGYVAEDVRQEFVEIFNRGTNAVPLAGWRLSQGVAFTFPSFTLQPEQRLVVAADADTNRFREAYQARFPAVTNAAILGGWTGTLANNGEDVELEDASSNRQDIVRYASQGDWALRRVGTPFPGSSGWWLGWAWTSPADAGGRSLELINAALSNEGGQNWAASLADGGTPGAPNSVAANEVAPLITDVLHRPAIPRSGNAVTVNARLTDEGGTSNLAAALYYRVDGAASFTNAPMVDDGLHGDGAAGDGVFGAVLPPRPDRTVVEFYVRAEDPGGHARTWPAPTDDAGTQGANALYQVDDTAYLGRQPIYRMVTRAAEWAAWTNLMDVVSQGYRSDAQMNGTLIAGEGAAAAVRYRVSIRNRGVGTRIARPHNLHVAIPNDDPWKGRTKLALNTRFVHAQVAGNAACAFAGLPNSYGSPVQVRLNGANLARATPVAGNINSYQFGSYFELQLYDGDWAAEHVPLDPDGNIYKGAWYLDWVQLNNPADLRYLGTNVVAYRQLYSSNGPTASSGAYAKLTNVSADDWSDLINLTRVLSNAPNSTYVAEVGQVADIDEWLRYFAFCSLVGNMETTLGTGTGDDYSSYRGMVDTRFQLLTHDLDTVLGQGDAGADYPRSIFKATGIPALNRLLKHPDIAPRYFEALTELADTVFAADVFDPLMDQWLGDWVDAATVQSMKDFSATRRASVLAQIPGSLSVTSSLPWLGGYPRTTQTTAAVWGQAHAIRTRAVRVNGSNATWSAWQAAWTNATVPLQPGLNRLRVESLDSNGVAFAVAAYDVWCDRGAGTLAGGTLGGTSAWTAASGPYTVTSSLTVASGGVLTIEPGTTVYLGAGVNVTVADGGRLLAEGSAEAPIRFGVAPGTAAAWGGLTVNGSGASPETRLAWVHVESNGTTAIHCDGGALFLDHVTFGTTTRQYLSLDASSFVVQDCVFPSGTGLFELVHGTGGIRSGGRGLFLRNFFGRANSVSGNYNDVVDFTSGNRPGPTVEFIDNVFLGSGDDLLDLDGSDAWIEGNIFLHAHKNGSPDTASAVSGGSNQDNASETSEITILGNIFYDCDHAAMAKLGNFYTLLNNTVVRQTHAGGLDTDGAVICLTDEGAAEGAGMYLEGNIVWDAEKLARDVTAASVTFSNNLMSLPWSGAGGGNVVADPRFVHVPELSETTNFASWADAQVMKTWFGLRPGSPALGAGAGGGDLGAVRPAGVTVSGEPAGTNRSTTATLRVGPRRTAGLPAAGWPDGSGYTRYRWRLDGGAWSAATSCTNPIVLSGLAQGAHRVDVAGMSDAGRYQDDPALGTNARLSSSRTWIVDTGWVGRVRINEILADNSGALTNAGQATDFVELYNEGPAPANLSGMGLTDDPADPYQFAFPAGTVLAAGAYLVVFADKDDAAPGLHLGFGLGRGGDELHLFAAPADGGAEVDGMVFGAQLTDLSIGRLPGGGWGLTLPTFGGANAAAPVGEPAALRINEWLADGAAASSDDLIELYNTDALPVPMGGCHLTDTPASWPGRHRITPLSFVAGRGFALFIADGDPEKGADHVDFALSREGGMIGLFDPDLRLIDQVIYGAQQTDVSEGRTPNGGPAMDLFDLPSPGGPNAGGGAQTNITTTTVNLLWITNTWKYYQSGALAAGWQGTNYDDTAWPSGAALFYNESSSLPAPKNTPLTIGRVTYYFRTHFNAGTNLAGMTLRARTVLDDSAVVHLNGQEAPLRVGFSNATVVTASTLAERTVDNAVYEGPFDVPTTHLQPGDNVLAVEVHQVTTNSTDVVFGMTLDAVRSVTNVSSLQTVQLNEIVACRPSPPAGYPPDPDWVELFNGGTNDLDLAGHALTDDLLQPRRFVFATGSVVRAGGHFVVQCASDLPVSPTNTGFGLAASGGAVHLFAPGGDLADSVRYGLQAEEYSIGRAVDGAGSWVLTAPTLGGSNAVAALGAATDLRVNEWMADPASGDDWFEVCNTGALPVALGGLCLSPDPFNPQLSPIPALSFVGAGGRGFALFRADEAPDRGADHARFRLPAAGGSLGLYAPAGQEIDAVLYGAQSTGTSQGRLPDGAAATVAFPDSGSPGKSNWLPIPGLVVNEVLSHTDLPFEDAVEFANESDVDVPVGGWYLSNSADALRKFRIPDGAVVPAHGYLVVYEYQFNGGSAAQPFTFNSAHGDEVWLSRAEGDGRLTGQRAHEEFGATANGVSVGRCRTSVGVDFVAQEQRTFGTNDPPSNVGQFRLGPGAANALPRVGPAVITEIHYQPPPSGTNDNVQDEYVEVFNTTLAALPLYDPAVPTNTWRIEGDVDYAFPGGFALAPTGFALLVSFDPADAVALAAFRAKFGVAASVPVLGPYDGRLSNRNGQLRLLQPDPPQPPPHPDAGFVPYVLVERIAFGAAAPWPAGAAGTGHSLQRILATAYGNDPVNWMAAPPEAGVPNNPDGDADGLPDAWELMCFGGIAGPDALPGADPDRDGADNASELIAGTDPMQSSSSLRASGVAASTAGPVAIRFEAKAGRSYTVQFSDTLAADSWMKLADLDPAPADGAREVVDPAPLLRRFYRVVTPKLP